MSILCVGSVALDSVETPFDSAERVLGGSAVFFASAATLLAPVRVVGIVGDDYPIDGLNFLAERGADLSGIERGEGKSFFWAARYHADMGGRDTLATELGVFADFQPKIPEAFRKSRHVFLGNIDPALQHDVLDQVEAPEVVACDTMNYWIEGNRDSLVSLLDRVNILMINDEEARQLANESNLVRASKWIRDRGPDMVVVKKGEHGAVLFADDWVFFVPGFPLEEVFDPTGAGDSFAGGFMGHLEQTGSLDPVDLRRSMVYGSIMGSFAVERFSVERFVDLTPSAIEARMAHFHDMTAFQAHAQVEERV